MRMGSHIPIVIVYETDEQANGSPTFDHIFASTPASLKDEGLYQALAVPWRAERGLRHVSIRMVAIELGAAFCSDTGSTFLTRLLSEQHRN